MNAILPSRIPKKAKRASRWRSPAHSSHVRSFACANCGSTQKIEAAHVRIGSGAGISQKPDDWRMVPLCGECHARQHSIGEDTFWSLYSGTHGHSVNDLLAALIKASPKRHDIERVMKEREDA